MVWGPSVFQAQGKVWENSGASLQRAQGAAGAVTKGRAECHNAQGWPLVSVASTDHTGDYFVYAVGKEL